MPSTDNFFLKGARGKERQAIIGESNQQAD